MSFLSQKETILFQGDSITDWGRNRDEFYNLGTGYPLLVASQLAATMQDHDFTFINRGVGGDRVVNLAERWQEDCLALKPTVLSVLVGINDTWRRYDNNDPTDVKTYKEGYRQLLKRVPEGVKLILLEPFVLPVNPGQDAWREDLDPKIYAVRELAREFGALFVPLDGVFAAACAKKSPVHWSGDGVHPSYAGHGIIAREWIKAATA